MLAVDYEVEIRDKAIHVLGGYGNVYFDGYLDGADSIKTAFATSTLESHGCRLAGHRYLSQPAKHSAFFVPTQLSLFAFESISRVRSFSSLNLFLVR